jgi:small subunit ribosomal protein S8
MRDIISDTLTRLRNSSRVKSTKVILLSTQSTRSIASILKREGYIEEVVEVDEAPRASREPSYAPIAPKVAQSPSVTNNSCYNKLHVFLKYEGKKMRPSFSHVKSISTPGVRKYAKSNAIPQVLGGLGTVVLSTSQGLITDTEARKLGIGGELLFAIW